MFVFFLTHKTIYLFRFSPVLIPWTNIGPFFVLFLRYTLRYSSWSSITKCVQMTMIVLLCCTPVWMQPVRVKEFHERKSCGHELVERVGRICTSRGGLKSYPVHGRVRRGIVNECCANKCADHHIYAYCSNGDKRETQPAESLVQVASAEYSEYEMRPEPLALMRTLEYADEAAEATDVKIETTTASTPTSRLPTTRFYSSGNGHIDSLTLNRILENLDRQQHNDFQVGTVPPEYRIMPVIPSRSRIRYWFNLHTPFIQSSKMRNQRPIFHRKFQHSAFTHWNRTTNKHMILIKRAVCFR